MASSNYNAIVPDEQPGLRTFTDGKEDGPVIVFVHGWPDDHALWDKQVCLRVAEEGRSPLLRV